MMRTAGEAANCPCGKIPYPHWHNADGWVIALYNPKAVVGVVVMPSPSRPAMAAANNLLEWMKRGESTLDPVSRVATIIDAHFAPYLEAVEAVKAAMAAGYPMSADTVAEDEVIDALWQRTKDALAKIDAMK